MKTLPSKVCVVNMSDKWDYVSPQRESNYDVSLEGLERGTNGQKGFTLERITNKLREAKICVKFHSISTDMINRSAYVKLFNCTYNAWLYLLKKRP